MTSKIVRQYLTQDLNQEEKQSYLNYINGNELSTDWIEKASSRREPILLAELQCACGGWVNVSERGVCKCSNGHSCYNLVIQSIQSFS